MTRNEGHWAVQGHSRSPVLVPIESPYATNGIISVNPVLHRFQVIVAYLSNYRFLTISFEINPFNASCSNLLLFEGFSAILV